LPAARGHRGRRARGGKAVPTRDGVIPVIYRQFGRDL
jgi:hypothetical protein